MSVWHDRATNLLSGQKCDIKRAMRRLIFAIAFCSLVQLVGSPGLAADQKVATQTKWPECFCTDRYGKRHEIGDIICLTVDSRSYEAKCVMVQNNPFWRDLERGCLSSSLPEKMTPKPDTMMALYQ